MSIFIQLALRPRNLLHAPLLALVLCGSASAQPLLDPAVAQRAALQGRAPVILTLREQVDTATLARSHRGEARLRAVVAALQDQAESSQAPLRRWLQQRGVTHRSYWVANFLSLEADTALLDALAQRPDLARIDLDARLHLQRPVETNPSPLGPVRALEYGVTMVSAPALWAMGYRGQGVLVGGQDTGYQWDHPALRASYAGWNGSSAQHNYHWYDAIHSGGGVCGANSPVPCDDNAHGTHTMGTIVGDDGGSNQIGVAPDARWIGCRNMDQGDGTPTTYSECFQFFLAPTDVAGNNPDPARAPHVINNSWGCPPVEGCNTPNILRTVVENVRNAGILLVVSAGNSGSSCSSVTTPPAIYAASFVVGAINSGKQMASFSSRGPVTVDGSNRLKPDIVAPGVSTRSAVPGGGYSNFSGTSMAGPHVAGVAALLMSIDPSLKRDPERIESLLRQTAVVDVVTTQVCGGLPATTVPNHVFGHGRVDALSAARNGLGVIWISGFE